MPIFFNGRLWVSPATMSAIDDSGLANKGLSVGNVLAILGTSEGGEPFKAIRLGSPTDAANVLRSGPLKEAAVKAFDPSAQTGAPATVIAIRVNPATQASLSLLAAGNPAVTLVSTDYGLYTNGIKVKIESGTIKGKKITTQLGTKLFTQDNVFRDAFSIQHTGAAATATLSVTDSTVTLQAPAGTTVATIDLTSFPTIQQLVDRINAVSGFVAAVLDGNGDRPALSGLDGLTNVSVKTLYTVTANLQAVVDYFNSAAEGFVTATRGAAGAAPDNIAFTYLAGGSDGIVTNSSWASGYETLQGEDVQWVVPLTSNAAVHAMNDSHVAFMSNVARMERRGIVGTASGTSDDNAILAAKALNSDRTSLVHLGFFDFNSDGKLALMEPFMLASLIAAAFSGSNPGTALTNKSLKIRGLERKLRNPVDTDKLILGGVLCVEDTPRGYKVVQSITTWLNNTNYNRVEISVGVALDFVARNVRNALDDLRGQKGTVQLLGQAKNRVESALRELARPEPVGPGVLAGDAESPAYKNISVSLEGDVMRVEFQCSPVIPVNYIPVAIYAVPFSGSASA